MSNIKQWVPNKVNAKKAINISYPFDGSIITQSGNQAVFQFSTPGLINGAFPENMWDSTGSLLKLNIPSGDKKWFIVCESKFNTSIVSSTITIKDKEPTQASPVINQSPSNSNVILWSGYGIRKAWKVCKGNILIKPMLILRNYKTDVPCGEIPFEDYYVMIGYS